MEFNFEQIKKDFVELTEEFFQKIKIKKNNILILGCSTSEITGGMIGKASAPEVGAFLIDYLYEKCVEYKVDLAVQCCEHLNRAIVIENGIAENQKLEIVSAIPKTKAGGSIAESAYKRFKNPVLVEFIKADFGIDIGDTFIGMHLKHVAVPLRLNKSNIGKANVKCAVTRPKYIGGKRAQYE